MCTLRQRCRLLDVLDVRGIDLYGCRKDQVLRNSKSVPRHNIRFTYHINGKSFLPVQTYSWHNTHNVYRVYGYSKRFSSFKIAKSLRKGSNKMVLNWMMYVAFPIELFSKSSWAITQVGRALNLNLKVFIRHTHTRWTFKGGIYCNIFNKIVPNVISSFFMVIWYPLLIF